MSYICPMEIRDEDEVCEEIRKSISFDGSSYSVKLPRKAGHMELPTNYSTSLRHLKSRVARLEKEPEVLREYEYNHQRSIRQPCKRESGGVGNGGRKCTIYLTKLLFGKRAKQPSKELFKMPPRKERSLECL